MTVINHDFRKDKRHAVRRFTQLLSLDSLHEANIHANPLPYLERASERIYQLERTLFEAVLAAKPRRGDAATPAEMVEISKAEHDRLLACLAIVEGGLAALGGMDDEP